MGGQKHNKSRDYMYIQTWTSLKSELSTKNSQSSCFNLMHMYIIHISDTFHHHYNSESFIHYMTLKMLGHELTGKNSKNFEFIVQSTRCAPHASPNLFPLRCTECSSQSHKFTIFNYVVQFTFIYFLFLIFHWNVQNILCKVIYNFQLRSTIYIPFFFLLSSQFFYIRHQMADDVLTLSKPKRQN